MAKSTSQSRTASQKLRQANRSVLKFFWRILRIVSWPFRPALRPLAGYMRGVRQEFRRVTWPTRVVTWKLTIAVVALSMVFAGFVAIVDYGLNVLFEKVIIKG